MRVGIDTLFPELAPGSFVKDYFPNRPIFFHGSASRFGSLFSEPCFESPETLIDHAASDTVIGYLTASDRTSQVRVPKETAKELYHHGMSLEVPAIQQQNSAVLDLVEALGMDLGLKPGTEILSNATLSPGGDAFPQHFDHIEVLCLQIKGIKRFTYARNKSVDFPAHAYFPKVAANVRDSSRQAAAYFPSSFPGKMPAGATTVDLRPGSALLVPRGYWHKTHALEPSMTLIFLLKTPSVDVRVLSALSELLQRRAAWRAPLPLLPGRPRSETVSRIAPLVEMLKAELTPEALVRFFPGTFCDDEFRRVPGVDIAASVTPDGRGKVVITADEDGSTIETEPDWLDLFRWVAAQTKPFAFGEVCERHAEVSIDAVEYILSLLIAERALVSEQRGS